MKRADELTNEQLVAMVNGIQSILWRHGDEWNPGKPWDADAIEYVAAALDDAGLRPAESFGGGGGATLTALAGSAIRRGRHHYRVSVTGRRYGLSVTYRDASGPAEALQDRLTGADPHSLPDRGEAKVVRIAFDRQRQVWEDQGEPLFFKWRREQTGLVIRVTEDKRVIKGLRCPLTTRRSRQSPGQGDS